jgi:hypothetical protein
MFGLLMLFFLTPARAEYRAYELSLMNRETGAETRIVSTLDHIQYRGYHPLGPGEDLSYVDSWMCWDNTSRFKAICHKPQRDPAQSPK